MNKLFSLKVIACNKVFYDGECKSLVFPAPDGEMGILAHHSDMTIAVSLGNMRITTKDDEVIEGVVGTGIVQFVNNRALVLVETAEKPEEIDIRRAEDAKIRAEERLRQKMSQQEYYHSKAALARAMSRLKNSGRYRSTKI